MVANKLPRPDRLARPLIPNGRQALTNRRVEINLLDPVAQRLVRDPQVLGDLGARFPGLPRQADGFLAELQGIGRACSGHRGLLSGASYPKALECARNRVNSTPETVVKRWSGVASVEMTASRWAISLRGLGISGAPGGT